MRVPTEFDDKQIAFWPRHEELLPILSCNVAQVYLGMSSSSVPVECNTMFSTTGTISRKNSSTGPDKLNRVVFIHDNFLLAVDEYKCVVEIISVMENTFSDSFMASFQ